MSVSSELKPVPRFLMGPGPSDVHPRVLNAVKIPESVDDAEVCGRILNEFGIEIGVDLGDFADKVWRIGIMGHSCTENHVNMLLTALRHMMQQLDNPRYSWNSTS